jgi:hypothetical protein
MLDIRAIARDFGMVNYYNLTTSAGGRVSRRPSRVRSPDPAVVEGRVRGPNLVPLRVHVI